MPDSPSIEEIVAQLQTLLRERYDAGISAILASDPNVAVPGTAVTVRARIFASADVLAQLAPVLVCKEDADFDPLEPSREREQEGFREYAFKLPQGRLQPDTTYHFTLHADPDADALAQCSLHTFSARVVAEARREIRDILLEPLSEPPARSGKRRPGKRRER